jgi:hypothetical protein
MIHALINTAIIAAKQSMHTQAQDTEFKARLTQARYVY